MEQLKILYDHIRLSVCSLQSLSLKAPSLYFSITELNPMLKLNVLIIQRLDCVEAVRGGILVVIAVEHLQQARPSK